MKKNPLAKVLFIAISTMLQFTAIAQEETLKENEKGWVNFDLSIAPKPNYGRQEMSLMGCNTEVTSRTRLFYGDTNLKWGANNQIFKEVPYGWQADGKREYYVSKYYMASPPVMQFPYNGKQVNIGLVLPDRFTFMGEKPAQMVRLDYSILEPVYLNFIHIEYDHDKDSTCSKLGVNLVPLVIECDDFNWRPDSLTPTAKGASGIARIKNDTLNSKVFLPSYGKNKDYLHCNLTILDDIILKYDISFLTDDGPQKTINMTQYYTKKDKIGKPIQLVCKSRTINPSGCQENGKPSVIVK